MSIVVPCRNSAADLVFCLAALSQSSFRDFECIVVDDASDDDSCAIAQAAAVCPQVIRLPFCQGAAAARNAGVRATSADLVVFLDSDVVVYPTTLSEIMAAFEEDPALGAVFGAYDDQPACPNFYSQFRNLLHCYVHRHGHRNASTFWTGCGAIRRDLFLAHNGFGDCGVEDIELGYRLLASGVKNELRPELQVKHLKRWTFWSTAHTDLVYRGIPWTRLILQTGVIPNDLNVRRSQRVSVALAFLGVICLLLTLFRPALFAISFGCFAATAVINAGFYRFLWQRRGSLFAAMSVPAHLFHLANAGLALVSGYCIFLARHFQPKRSPAKDRPAAVPEQASGD